MFVFGVVGVRSFLLDGGLLYVATAEASVGRGVATLLRHLRRTAVFACWRQVGEHGLFRIGDRGWAGGRGGEEKRTQRCCICVYGASIFPSLLLRVSDRDRVWCSNFDLN